MSATRASDDPLRDECAPGVVCSIARLAIQEFNSMKLPNNTLPFSIGAAGGAILISGLALANGWVVASSKAHAQMEEAIVTAQASVCAARAEDFLKESNSTIDLEGYRADARAKREDLAKKYASPLQGQESVDAIVVTACARMLNKPHT